MENNKVLLSLIKEKICLVDYMAEIKKHIENKVFSDVSVLAFFGIPPFSVVFFYEINLLIMIMLISLISLFSLPKIYFYFYRKKIMKKNIYCNLEKIIKKYAPFLTKFSFPKSEIFEFLLNELTKEEIEKNLEDIINFAFKYECEFIIINYVKQHLSREEIENFMKNNPSYIYRIMKMYITNIDFKYFLSDNIKSLLEDNLDIADIVSLKKEILVGEAAKNLKQYLKVNEIEEDKKVYKFLNDINYKDENTFILSERLNKKEEKNISNNILNDCSDLNQLIPRF